jgi:hypothetical protein
MINGKIFEISAKLVHVAYTPLSYSVTNPFLESHLSAIDAKLSQMEVSGSSAPPLRVPIGTTYTVQANTQVLIAYPIEIDGEIVLNGLIHQVD